MNTSTYPRWVGAGLVLGAIGVLLLVVGGSMRGEVVRDVWEAWE